MFSSNSTQRNHLFAITTQTTNANGGEKESPLYDYVMQNASGGGFSYCSLSPMNKTNVKEIRSNETDYVMAITDSSLNQYSSNYTYYSSFESFGDVAEDAVLSKAFSKSNTKLNDPDERIINVEIASQKKVVLTNKKMYIAAQSEELVRDGIPLPPLQPGDQFKFVRTSSRTDYFFLLTELGKVYCYGKNSSGVFGLGSDHQKEFSEFTLQQFLSSLPSPVIDFECGYLFVVARCKNGNCYGCGYNCYINVGVDGDRTVDLNEFTLISKLEGQVKKHACGSFHSLYLTNSNELYGCGLMTDGQLGATWSDSYNNNDCVNLKRITFGDVTHFKSICCSGYSSFALSQNNELFHFGKNSAVKHQSLSRKTDLLTMVPLLYASELIGDFGRKQDEIIDLAIMKGSELYCGIIMCREGIQKGLIEMESNLKRFAIQDGAKLLGDISIHCFHN